MRTFVDECIQGNVIGGRGVRGVPSVVRIFAGWRKGAQVSGVRGSGGGWSEAGSQGEGGEKKTPPQRYLLNLGEK